MDASEFYSSPAYMLEAMGAGQPGHVPMPKLVSRQDIEREAKPRRTRIFRNFTTLGAILDRHEATIHKRWLKKTREQRRRILLSAWLADADANGSNNGSRGVLSLTHRPDFAAIYKEGSLDGGRQTVHRDAYLLPHLNQEDLSQPRPLLLMMRSRARHSPAAFASADLNDMHVGHIQQALVPWFLNYHIMVFIGREFPATPAEKYGELINWDDHPDAFNWMMNKRAPQPGDGLLILEAQDRTLAFLIACAKEILHDLAEEQLTSGSLDAPLSTSDQQSTTPQTDALDKPEDALSWAALAADAPYRAPMNLDFEKLEPLLKAKRDAAADEIWSMREDPSYFSDVLLLGKEHRQEMLKDTNGRPHPIFTSGREEILWMRVIGNEISSAYLAYEVWHELHAQAADLRTLMKKHLPNLSPEGDLPEELLSALLRFQHHLTQATKGPIGILKMTVVASPPMRRFFARRPLSDPTDPGIHTAQKPGADLDKHQKRLLWLLSTLWNDGKPLFYMGLTRVVDELQRLIDAEPSAKAVVSDFVAAVIADLAICCECLRQLDLFQPWANTFEDELVDRKEAIMKGFDKTAAPWGRLLSGLKKNERILYTYGVPTERRFYYPIDKRRTRENVEALREAEVNLDLFWAKVDQSMSLELKETQLSHLLATPRALQRTAPWVEVPTKPAPQKENERPANAPTEEEDLLKPLSQLYLDLQRRTERTLQSGSPGKLKNVKSKTRGIPRSSTGSDNDAATDQPLAAPAPIYHVDARALKTFRTLFYTPSTTATPGELAWTDFLHALTAVGFGARKLYGSVWQFGPLPADRRLQQQPGTAFPAGERSIQFHEPHPGGKMAFRVARRYGRRLNRAYGWDVGMFVLATPAGNEGKHGHD